MDKRDKWSLHDNGGIVAQCMLKGHNIDCENAVDNENYRASPDCHVNGEEGIVKTLALLVVPLVNTHGKTVGALRASRFSSDKAAKNDFGSVDSLLMCIIAAALQCIWNSVGHGVQQRQGKIDDSDLSVTKSVETSARKSKPGTSSSVPYEQAEWAHILTEAIDEFDKSHAAILDRLSKTHSPQESFPSLPVLQQQAAYATGTYSAVPFLSSNGNTYGHHSGSMSARELSDFSSPMGQRSLRYSPQTFLPRKEHGVVSFVHNELI